MDFRLLFALSVGRTVWNESPLQYLHVQKRVYYSQNDPYHKSNTVLFYSYVCNLFTISFYYYRSIYKCKTLSISASNSCCFVNIFWYAKLLGSFPMKYVFNSSPFPIRFVLSCAEEEEKEGGEKEERAY